MEKFEQTYSYKLIYVFSMPYETHKGTKEMLCVGWDGKVVKEVMNALNANE